MTDTLYAFTRNCGLTGIQVCFSKTREAAIRRFREEAIREVQPHCDQWNKTADIFWRATNPWQKQIDYFNSKAFEDTISDSIEILEDCIIR